MMTQIATGSDGVHALCSEPLDMVGQESLKAGRAGFHLTNMQKEALCHFSKTVAGRPRYIWV